MKQKWEVLIVNKVAEQEIVSLSADLKAKFLRITELLINLEPRNISMPHIKPLEDKL